MRTRPVQLDARELKGWVVGDGQVHHGQAVFHRGNDLFLFVRRVGSQYPEQPVETELPLGFGGKDKMSQVRRVEGPAEKTDLFTCHGEK